MLDGESDIKTVALYTRVSTDEQAREGFSLDSQTDRLRSYCMAREWNIVGEYIDPGYTGRNTRRPQYKQMFEDIDKWDALLVIKMDRIHRNQKNFLSMMEDLKKQNKQFVSMSESFDTSTAMGRFVMNIIQGIAQLESEQIGERVGNALVQKAKQGEKFMGHRTAFGYRWNPKTEKFIADPEKLDLVKQVFQMYLDGYTMRQIAKKVGKANTTVKYFLHNCFYAGYERWCHNFRRVKDLDPLTSIKDFNKVQELMRERCHSHRQYKPMLIQDKDQFKLNKDTIKAIPVINRAKHNYNF